MSSETTPLGQPTPVDVGAIERELNELWRQATDGHPDALTRVCVLNLVVATASSEVAARATETVTQLMARHPNRAIVVDAQAAAPADRLEAWVQANCTLPGPGRPQVCCEQITITARDGAVERVPGTVLPLLVPDVPVVLWWPRGEPFADPLFVKLGDLADRIIVDSSTFDAPLAGLRRLSELLSTGRAVSNLSWARLTPWRELTAQFFDAPAMVPHLRTITRVLISYDHARDRLLDLPEALLLLGWLASRLGWAPGEVRETGDLRSVTLRRPDGGTVVAEVRALAGPAEGEPPAILALQCDTARFAVARDTQPGCAVARSEVDGMEPIRRVVRLEERGPDEQVSEELRTLGRDRGFEGALHLASRMFGAG